MADKKERLTAGVNTPCPVTVTRESGATFKDIAATFQQLGNTAVEGCVEALSNQDIDQLKVIYATCSIRLDKIAHQLMVKYRVTLDELSDTLNDVAKNTDELAKSGHMQSYAGRDM